MTVDCNRIMIKDGNKLCIVKDSCMGCKIDADKCAINDMLEQNGTLESWKRWDFPNFRDRVKEGRYDEK